MSQWDDFDDDYTFLTFFPEQIAETDTETLINLLELVDYPKTVVRWINEELDSRESYGSAYADARAERQAITGGC